MDRKDTKNTIHNRNRALHPAITWIEKQKIGEYTEHLWSPKYITLVLLM